MGLEKLVEFDPDVVYNSRVASSIASKACEGE